MPDLNRAKALLSEGLSSLNLVLSEEVQEQMIEFLLFLQKWNQAYNLTAIKDFEAMITHHLLDSLSVLPYLKAERVLDVGSGAGFPGIPLALCLPDTTFALLDTNGKKTRFLFQASVNFKLSNVEVVHQRMESYRPDCGFDAIICRAVGQMADIIAATTPVLAPDGYWLFMKGRCPSAELDAVSQAAEVHRLTVLGEQAERHVVVIKKE